MPDKPQREGVLSLSTYFRNTLAHTDSFIHLDRSEDDRTFGFRKGQIRKKLKVIIEVPDEVRSFGAFIFTLVENAVKHGVLPMEDGAWYQSLPGKVGDIQICIEDSGVGIRAETIRRLGLIRYLSNVGVVCRNV